MHKQHFVRKNKDKDLYELIFMTCVTPKSKQKNFYSNNLRIHNNP